MGGAANVDDNWLDDPNGAYNAMSLRSFDASTNTWSIWWLDQRNPTQLDPPVRGNFTDDTGNFVCEDTLNGRNILVRFRWTNTATDEPTWQQAFSADNGTTWEDNWVMTFTRTTNVVTP